MRKHQVIVGQKREEGCFHAIGAIHEIRCHADVLWAAEVFHPGIFFSELFDHHRRLVARRVVVDA